MREVRFCDLPEDVVVHVLALLDVHSLMTARLVCSSWRATLIRVVKRLSFECSIAPATLLTRLSIFTCVSDLHLRGLPQARAPVLALDVPACRSRLRSVSALCASTLERISEPGVLSGLTRLCFWAPDPLPTCAKLVAHCTGLRVLDLGLSGQTLLDALTVLASLPALRELMLPLKEEGTVDLLAAFTQLTAVRDTYLSPYFTGSLRGLAGIRGLRALSLRGLDSTGEMLGGIVSHAPHLEDLQLYEDAEPSTAGVVAAFSHLTRLRLSNYKPAQGGWRHGSLASILRGRLHSVRPAWQFSTLLVHLDVSTETFWRAELVKGLTALTRLTHLQVESMGGVVAGRRFDSWTARRAAWPDSTFLVGLTRLEHLSLCDVLDTDGVATRVSRLLRLARLTFLELETVRRICRRDMKGFYGGSVRHGWASTAFAERGGFLQLTGLRDLAELWMGGDWTSASTREFVGAFAKLGHELGRPQLKFFVNGVRVIM